MTRRCPGLITLRELRSFQPSRSDSRTRYLVAIRDSVSPRRTTYVVERVVARKSVAAHDAVHGHAVRACDAPQRVAATHDVLVGRIARLTGCDQRGAHIRAHARRRRSDQQILAGTDQRAANLVRSL